MRQTVDQSEFVLGTVQLGLPYGVANQSGMPSYDDAVKLVRRALDLGIKTFDTARSYGSSEERVGDALSGDQRGHIITKLDPLEGMTESTPVSTVRRAVNSSIRLSCLALARDHIPTLTLHRAAHLTACNGTIWREVNKLRGVGKIGALGVSVQTPEEATEALNHPEIMQIQLPFNLLDWRWRQSNFPERCRLRRNVRVHARSSLLQGLLISEDPEIWPQIDGVDPMMIRERLNRLVEQFNRENVLDLCLAYVRSHEWIDGIVVGAESEDQLEQNYTQFKTPPLSQEQCEIIQRSMPIVPEQLLNPALWPVKQQS
jgi:aryl-alcohol dehydrogenase-like predicted oxidoreductase